ncbi:MAG: hypothetical protein F6J87_06615 [Spirulina sp. SIO3F2]|nr:hypothetical protein [Spirulina sp. SIO3F2]
MAILFLLVSWLALWITWNLNPQEPRQHRERFLKVTLIHAGWMALTTELLSVGKLLTPLNISLVWAILAGVHLVLLWRVHTQNAYALELWRDELEKSWSALALLDRWYLGGVGAIALLCGLTALIAAPNTVDVMTYHLPRVMHWLHYHSTAHYPTHNLRQISFTPGASYLVTHVYALGGGDRAVNLVQSWAFVGVILGVSLLGKSWGLSASAQRWSMIVAATIPMAILQSTTAQNDLIATFWLVCFAYFVLRLPPYTWMDLGWCAISLGLVVLTKPTVTLFSLPLCLILGIRLWHQRGSLGFVWSMGVATLSLGMSGPYFSRNFGVFSDVLGIDTGTRTTAMNLVLWASNFLKHLALNLPWTPLWQRIEGFHTAILGVNPNDPATTFAGGRPFLSAGAWQLLMPDEDFVASPLHTLLSLAAIILLCILGTQKLKQIKQPIPQPIPMQIWGLLGSVIIGAVLFCAVLKWQAWSNRFLLPWFVLCSPLVGYVIAQHYSPAMRKLLAILLLISGLFYSFVPLHHPLIPLTNGQRFVDQSPSILTLPREDLYFSASGKGLKAAHQALDQAIRDHDCQIVGLDIMSNDWEYLLWAFNPQVRFTHINVKNFSIAAPAEVPEQEVCGVIRREPDSIEYLPIPLSEYLADESES